MPTPIAWTAEKDQFIRASRAESRTWDAIAEGLGISRTVVIRRSVILRVPATALDIRRRRVPDETPTWQKLRHDAGSEPLPAWHPIAAAVLMEATAMVEEVV